MNWKEQFFRKIKVGDRVKVIKKSMGGSNGYYGNLPKYHVGHIGIVTEDTIESSIFKGKRWLHLDNDGSGIIEDLVIKVIQ